MIEVIGRAVVPQSHFDFHRPGSRLIEPFLRKWLAADMDKEVTRLARFVGATGADASEPERT